MKNKAYWILLTSNKIILEASFRDKFMMFNEQEGNPYDIIDVSHGKLYIVAIEVPTSSIPIYKTQIEKINTDYFDNVFTHHMFCEDYLKTINDIHWQLNLGTFIWVRNLIRV